jgi:hypothetical protein
MKRVTLMALSVLLSAVSVFAGAADERVVMDNEAAQRSFFAPGWGQWYKGHPARGTCISVAEATALLGAYVSYSSAQDARSDYQAGTASYSNYTRRVDMTNYFLIAAGLIWAYNVADAYASAPAPHLSLSMGDGRMASLTYRIEFQ